MSKFDFTTEAAALPSSEYRLTIPVGYILTEAEAVAQFAREHLKGDKKKGTPGLADAKITSAQIDELEALVVATLKAQEGWTMAVDPKADRSKLERARFLINEIDSVLGFYLDDGVDNEEDVRFQNVVNAHKDEPDTSATLSLALDEYCAVAELHEKEIDGLGGFDAKLLKEARKLATELRAAGPAEPATAESQAALAKRNRLLQLLDGRVRKVRSATKFVFRSNPEIVRKVASAYERKRRIDAKRAATRKKNGAQTGPTPEPTTAPAAPHA